MPRRTTYGPSRYEDAFDAGLLALGAAVVAAAAVLLYLILRRKWTALRATIAAPPPGMAVLERPGFVTDRLAPDRWPGAWAACLEAAGVGPVARDPALTAAAREVTAEAVRFGEPRSVLAKADGRLVYVLAVPGRLDQPDRVARCEPLADGWPAHAARLRRGLGPDDRGAPLVGVVVCADGMLRDPYVVVRPDATDDRPVWQAEKYPLRLV